MRKVDKNTQDIDFVITWVDGNDLEWKREKAARLGHTDMDISANADNRKERYRDWDNLRYWFRGMEKYAPWVRKVHFVTWGHIPQWLNMKKHESVFLKGDDLKLSWWKMLYEKWKWLIRTLFPFFENLVCFVPFFMMNNRTVGSEYFANLDPFLLYVLLFAIVYGQQQATFSAILAVAGYMFRQMYTRSSFEVLIDYNTYVWIAQLFILGLVVGYMRDQIRIMRLERQELEEHLHRQIVDIRDINESNVRVKEVMEQQLIDHKDSIGKIYSITAGLEQRMPDEVIFYAVEMLGKLMKTKDEVAVDAMKLLKDQGIKARWYILGEGELRNKLQQKIDSLGLKEDFLLLGAKENPYPYYKQCDLYVHATRFEGKSIAIQEAQVLGCTILVSDCSGNREQVENGTDGILCQLSPEDISRKIAELLGNEEKCREYGKKATVRISDEQGDILKLFEIV